MARYYLNKYALHARNPACQIQNDNNTLFALHWLPSFALNVPTEKETKDPHHTEYFFGEAVARILARWET